MQRSARLLLLAVLALSIVAAKGDTASPAAQEREDEEAERLDNAAAVFRELRDTKDGGIPQRLIDRARCVAVIPGVVKGALGWGARHGRGAMSCRDSSGRWGPPVFLVLTGGSFGFQIGLEKADVVLFFMTDKSARSLVESRFTVGAKAGVAAGPAGRTAEADTDIRLDAEIYSYARSKGLFAGVSLEGAKVRPDGKANERFYGKSIDPKAVLFRHQAPRRPAAAGRFLEALP